MPYCRARARLTDRDAEEGKITKRKAEAALREILGEAFARDAADQ